MSREVQNFKSKTQPWLAMHALMYQTQSPVTMASRKCQPFHSIACPEYHSHKSSTPQIRTRLDHQQIPEGLIDCQVNSTGLWSWWTVAV